MPTGWLVQVMQDRGCPWCLAGMGAAWLHFLECVPAELNVLLCACFLEPHALHPPVRRTLAFLFACVRSAVNVHNMLLTHMLRLPKTFFDTNPAGAWLGACSAILCLA